MADVILEKESVDTGSSFGKSLKTDAASSEKKETPSGEQNNSGDDKSREGEKSPEVIAQEKAAADKAEQDRIAAEKNNPPFDKEKYATELLEEVFGAKGVDKETAKKIAAAAKDLPALSAKLADLEKNKTEFANDYVKGLNEYVKQGGNKDTYDKIQALDIDNIKGLEAIKALYKWNHPELTEKQIDRKLAKQYSQTEESTDEEKEDGQVDITIDSSKAIKELRDIKSKYSVPDAERDRLAEEDAEKVRVESWQPKLNKIVDDFNSIDVVLETDDKGNPSKTFTYKVTDPAIKKSLLADIGDVIRAWDVQPTDDIVKEAATVVADRFYLRERANIHKAIWTEANTVIEKKYREKYENGESPVNGDKKQSTPKKDNREELFERQMNSI